MEKLKSVRSLDIGRRAFIKSAAGVLAFTAVPASISQLLAEEQKSNEYALQYPSIEKIKEAIEKVRHATVCVQLRTSGEQNAENNWTLGIHSGVAVDMSDKEDLVDPDYDKKYLLIATCLHGTHGVRETLRKRGDYDMANKTLYAWVRSQENDMRPNKVMYDKNRSRTDTMLLQIPRENLPEDYTITGVRFHETDRDGELKNGSFVVSSGTKELEFINHIDLGHVVETKVMPQGSAFVGPEVGYRLLKENKYTKDNGEDGKYTEDGKPFKMESGQSGGPVAMLDKDGRLTLVALQSSTVTTKAEGQPPNTLSYGSSYTNVRRILQDEGILKR
jgi:hypothetical protein